MSTTESTANILSDRACFDGVLLTALAYGALVMLCVQLVQVLIHRPRRDRVFYLIVVYTSIIFPLTTAGFFGKLRFAELNYVVNRDFVGGPNAFYTAHSNHWASVLSKTCNTIMPWIADLLLFYRVAVLCGRHCCWLMVLPLVVYLGRIAMSIPVLISVLHPSHPVPHNKIFNVSQSAAYLALNVFVTIAIWIRLFTMRHKAERVLGRLQASLYNSYSTLFVESGAFFTLWSMVYLLLKVTNSWAQDVFWQPYAYVVAITRMLIVLRIAQNRAWTRDILEAAENGVMEWGVSSERSVELDVQIDHRLQKSDTMEFNDTNSSIRTIR
ncbi:hypothetical protein CPB83DRAFT_856582 [Crepidotus variabilis]|uniref:Uncharacterized protein n=1 Tax=Crepidotus variabilis TaxID=179855 RepID=A0A9P6JNB7_9AGAR|nr:hypothetical protein CPB83DRAFT_856582 [Crepidotus variabilis]